ncbi:MAG: hypothetical protein WA102_12230 [Candidatus Methanoperedens sp.]
MPLYDPTPAIIAMSLEELNFILNWIREEQGESYDNPIAVLIGGWAVDAYNPWYGSVDIDLVTNSETKNTLKTVLKEERGYESYKIPGRINTVSKPTGDGEIKEIIIDFILRGRIKFEGQEAELDFVIPKEQTTIRELRGRISAVVPKRSMLLLLKLKASWDRAYRIDNGTSEDPEWEKSKLIKDYADILALIDPVHGGRELDLNFLGEKLTEFDFLKGCLRNIPENRDAVEKYRQMNYETAGYTIRQILSLTEVRG